MPDTEISVSFSDSLGKYSHGISPSGYTKSNSLSIHAWPSYTDEDIWFDRYYTETDLSPKAVSLIKSMLAKDEITRIRHELASHVLRIEKEIKKQKEEGENKEKLIEEQFN